MDRDSSLIVGAPEPGAVVADAAVEWAAPRRHSADRAAPYVLAALAIYVGVIGWLIVRAHFLPYGTDNNESFSAWVHARNLLRFGFGEAKGLTDEAYSPSPAAHPYVYTHEGNFPRLPIYVLMLLGVGTVEAQIAILAVLVGGATIYLAFAFFSRLAGPRLAFIVCAVFVTDYFLFMQWEVNTFRVWHGFLFFASLMCVQRLGGAGRRGAMVLLTLTTVTLFYFEVVFALFTTATYLCFAALTYRGRLDVLTRAAFAAVTGAGTALVCLVMQSAAHLGWPTAWRDLQLTFLNRNFFAQSIGTDGALRTLQFFLQHHIVYWQDNPNTIGYLRPTVFLQTFWQAAFGVDSGYFALLLWIVALAWVVRMATRLRVVRSSDTESREPSAHALAEPTSPRSGSGGWVTGAALFVLLYAAVNLASTQQSRLDDHFGSFPGFPSVWLGQPTLKLFAAALLLFGLFRVAVRERGWNTRRSGPHPALAMMRLRWRRRLGIVVCEVPSTSESRRPALPDVLADIPTSRLWLFALFLCLAAIYELLHVWLYGPILAGIWMRAIGAYFGTFLLQLGLLATLLLGLVIIVDGGRLFLRLRYDRALSAACRYLLAGTAGFSIAYVLSPGYLSQGYLVRYAPLVVFLLDVGVGCFFYLLAAMVGSSYRAMRDTSARRVRARGSQPLSRRRPANAHPAAVLLLSSFVLVFTAAFWGHVQDVYLSALSSDYSFLRQLAKPPYRGASFVSNTYAAPVSYFTGAWAYADYLVEDGVYIERGGRVVQIISGDLLWEADRDTNAGYHHPQYYVCIATPSWYTAPSLLSLRPGERVSRCSDQPLVRDAASGVSPVHHVLLAADPSPRDMWAIVRLDPAVRMAFSPLGEPEATDRRLSDLREARSIADIVQRFVRERGCYPSTLSHAFGQMPEGVGRYLRGPWPRLELYGTFDEKWQWVGAGAKAAFVGVIPYSMWKADPHRMVLVGSGRGRICSREGF